jgi:hypothetical protein
VKRDPESFHDRQLEAYAAAWLAGDDTAHEAAMYYCSTNDLIVPNWLRYAFAQNSPARLLGNEPARNGRSNSPVKRKWMNMIHLARYYTVSEVCEQQALQPKLLQALEAHPPRRTRRGALSEIDYKRRIVKFLGSTLEQAFDVTSRLLEGTPAAGKCDTIERSYTLVRVTFADLSKRASFTVPESNFMRSIGIPPFEDWPDPLSKVADFVALTNGE